MNEHIGLYSKCERSERRERVLRCLSIGYALRVDVRQIHSPHSRFTFQLWTSAPFHLLRRVSFTCGPHVVCLSSILPHYREI